MTVIEVCRRLQLGPGFSQKVFVKTLCKDVRDEIMFVLRSVYGITLKLKADLCEILGMRMPQYRKNDLILGATGTGYG